MKIIPRLKKRRVGKEASPLNKRKTKKWISRVIGLMITFVGLIIYNTIQRDRFFEGSDPYTALNTFFILNINVLVLIVLGILLVRFILKLLVESRLRRWGFRMKLRLSFLLMIVGGLPTLFFFAITNGYLNNNLNALFKGQYVLVLDKAAKGIEAMHQENDRRMRHFGESILTTLPKAPLEGSNAAFSPQEGIQKHLQDAVQLYLLDGVILHDHSFHTIAAAFSSADTHQKYAQLPPIASLQTVGVIRKSFNRLEQEEFIYRSVHRFTLSDGRIGYLEAFRSDKALTHIHLNAVKSHLENTLRVLGFGDLIGDAYRVHLFIFTLILMGIFLWFSIYLARQITDPISSLMEAAERIGKQNFDFTIELIPDGEIGELVSSFNTMLLHLRNSRNALEENRSILLSTNKALEEQNILTHLIIDNIQTCILSVDPGGYIRLLNPAALRLIGIKGDCLGQHFTSALPKELTRATQELLQQLTSTDIDNASNTFIIDLGGKKLHLALRVFRLHSPVKDELEPENMEHDENGYLLVAYDMTELNRASRIQAWREVATRIAHEIKNPLTPVQLSAERIYRHYLNKVDDSTLLRDCTQTIVAEVVSLKNMVNEFSNFARLPETVFHTADINEIIMESIQLFKGGTSENIAFATSCDPAIPQFMLDKNQIKRVLLNLVDNAIAALGSGGGTIEIQSAYLEESSTCRILIADNGKGIPEEFLEHIFDPYVTTKEEGTGLGLVIVNHIIADHQGTISVESTPGLGTTFCIDLPIS